MGKVPKKAVRKQIIALIPVCMNGLIVGCSYGWMPNAIYFLLAGEEVSATLFQCTLIASFPEIGRVLSAIPAGMLTDKYGRKKITIGVAILHTFAWLGLSLDNTSIIITYISRFVIGFGISLIDATSFISIGEIASPEIRGRLTGIYSIFLNAGVISVSIIAVIFSSYRSLARGVTILCIISLLSMYWAMETPRFLISISKSEQAKNNFLKIRQEYQENDVNEEFVKLQKYIVDENTLKSQLSWRQFLKMEAVRKPLLTGVLLNIFMKLSGGTLFGYYLTSLLPSNNYIPKIYYPLITQTFLFFISFGLPLFIDSFSRRSMFLFGAAAMVAINMICALANYFLVANEAVSIFEWVFAMGNILSSVCTDVILFPVNRAVRSELYPQAVKGFGGSLAVISIALSDIMLNQMYGFFKAYSHLYFMYFIFLMNSMILCLVIYFLLPEGCGVALPDIQMKFKSIKSKHTV
ncbi:putative metabolite transport protein YwtG [Planococcus citri]|uniref:putative metabolite transport protein YwtG n=1 Tax=Planococcus citri TaxID=170843 RepID=UPI0031FA07B7